MKKTLSLILALLVLLLPLAGCGSGEQNAASAEGTELQVYCFSAGKADAFLLTTENSAVLIDAGEKGFGKTILAYLEELGVTRLDAIIISHFDQDHVGGAAKVINNIAEVGLVLQNDYPRDSTEVEKYTTALQNAGLEAVTVTESYRFTLDGVLYEVDPHRQSDYDEDESNNSSLIVSVTNGESRLLFMGDSQTERLEEFLSYNKTSYDLLKVPHHGKAEPLLAELLANVQPRYAVITSSDEEPEAAETLELLEAAGVETWLTREGPVLIESDGKSLSVSRGEEIAVEMEDAA